MTTLLNSKPVIGVISGTGSGILYMLKTLITDDNILKWVAGIGIYVGLMVALMTAYLRLIEIIRKHKEKT